MEKIPKIVLDEAKKHGFNVVAFLGEYKGAEVYSVGIVDKDGFPLPTGLPTSILLRNGKTEIVAGNDGLKLAVAFK